MCVCLPHDEGEKEVGVGVEVVVGGGEGRGLELRYRTTTSVVALSTNEVTEIGYNLHTRTHPRPGVVCIRCLRWPRYNGYNIYIAIQIITISVTVSISVLSNLVQLLGDGLANVINFVLTLVTSARSFLRPVSCPVNSGSSGGRQ